ncbi:hypothetical protein C3495_06375 [Clostridiaceae bacterium 14S0207]|nr:hypothetical protein C3495_06375 [Clostridiaceae bacterium 14S0207]
MKQYIQNGYLVTEYDSGAMVKVLQGQEPKEVIPELPKNPIIELQKENKNLAETVSKLTIENKKKDSMANTMAKTIADLNIRINKLEKEGK